MDLVFSRYIYYHLGNTEYHFLQQLSLYLLSRVESKIHIILCEGALPMNSASLSLNRVVMTKFRLLQVKIHQIPVAYI